MPATVRNLFLGIAACLLATPFTTTAADAQTVAANNVLTYAKELFANGANPTLTTGSTNTTVTLVYDFSGTGNSIDASATGDFIFSLKGGARFAAAATMTDLVFTSGSTANVPTISVKSGGSVGDARVTYLVTAPGGGLANATSTFTFTLPDINQAAPVLGRSAPVRNPDANNSESDLILCVEVNAGTGTNTFDDYGVEDFVVASSKYAFTMEQTFRTATTTARVISPTDRRMLENVADQTYEVTIPGRPVNPRAVAISTLQVTNESSVVNASGTALGPDSSDDLKVEVEGVFADDDVLFFSADQTMEAAEQLTVTTTGKRGVNPDLAAGTWTLYYVPDGVTPIAQKLIETEYTIDLQQASDAYHDQTFEPLPLTLLIEGVNFQGYAYAIPPPAATDQGNVRIRCQEGVASCQVYLDCKDPSGSSVGNSGDGTLPSITLPGGGQITLQSHVLSGTRSLSTALGVAGWSGRLSCNIMSTNEIGVQVLTRSGGVLVNNTYVGGQLMNK